MISYYYIMQSHENPHGMDILYRSTSTLRTVHNLTIQQAHTGREVTEEPSGCLHAYIICKKELSILTHLLLYIHLTRDSNFKATRTIFLLDVWLLKQDKNKQKNKHYTVTLIIFIIFIYPALIFEKLQMIPN